MSSEPTPREIKETLDRILREIQEGNRLTSPEHIAQMTGFVTLKNQLDDIRAELKEIKGLLQR